MFNFNLVHDDVAHSKLLFILTIWSFSLSLYSTNLLCLNKYPAVQQTNKIIWQVYIIPKVINAVSFHHLAFCAAQLMLVGRWVFVLQLKCIIGHSSPLIPLSVEKLVPRAKGGTVNGSESLSATLFHDFL